MKAGILFLALMVSYTISYSQQPNILLVLLDDLRYDSYALTGNPISASPNLERIAHEGVHFEQAFVILSICRPSRATVLTGKYPNGHGVYTNAFPFSDTLPNLGSILQSNGYETAFIGKFHSSGVRHPGFDRWVSFSSQGRYYNPTLFINNYKTQVTGYLTDLLTDFTIDFIKKPRTTPFFAVLSHSAPHSPWHPAQEYDGVYDTIPISLPSTWKSERRLKPAFFQQFYFNLSEDSLYFAYRKYYEMLMSVDEGMGRIYHTLDSLGILDSTLIVVTSDNGFFMGDFNYDGKRLPYEPSIRIPIFARYPAWFSPGTVVTDQIALNLDMSSTFLDAAGVADQWGMQGVSLRNLANQSETRNSFLYTYYHDKTRYQYAPAARAIRTLNQKYIRYGCTQPFEEFYDLSTDPDEMSNAINDPVYQTDVNRLRAELDDLILLFGEPMDTLIDCETWPPDPNDSSNLVSVGPVPVRDFFWVHCTLSKVENVKIYLSDILGRRIETIFEGNLPPGLNKIQGNMESCPPGVYFVYLVGGKEVQALKLVKQ